MVAGADGIGPISFSSGVSEHVCDREAIVSVTEDVSVRRIDVRIMENIELLVCVCLCVCVCVSACIILY